MTLAVACMLAALCAWCAAAVQRRHTHALTQDASTRASTVPELLQCVDALAIEFRGGASVSSAVAAVAERLPLLATVAEKARAETLDEALNEWSEEHRSVETRAVAGALALANAGAPGSSGMDAVGRTLRDRIAVDDEAKALMAPARVSALVVGISPLGALAMTALTDPAAIRLLGATATGRVTAVVGLTLETVGMLWMRRTMRSV